MKPHVISIILLTFIILGFSKLHAAPVLNPTNGHYYEAIPNTGNTGFTSWADARNQAASRYYIGMQGHLATLTSQGENNWVWGNLGVGLERYLLGGYQDPNDPEPAGNWKWVTGEPWVFNGFSPGEPNNGNGAYDEDALAFTAIGTWNDLPNSEAALNGFNGYVWGYVVEYEPLTTPVPEPATMLLIGSGLIGLAGVRKKFKK